MIEGAQEDILDAIELLKDAYPDAVCVSALQWEDERPGIRRWL